MRKQINYLFFRSKFLTEHKSNCIGSGHFHVIVFRTQNVLSKRPWPGTEDDDTSYFSKCHYSPLVSKVRVYLVYTHFVVPHNNYDTGIHEICMGSSNNSLFTHSIYWRHGRQYGF